MPERLALLRRMDAAGRVPQELGADFNGHRATLRVRLPRSAWTQEHAQAPRRKGGMRAPPAMLA
eukprot:7310909-Lingulodinium_polyedra.AAC.1